MELLKTIKKAAETQFNESGSRILFQRRKKKSKCGFHKEFFASLDPGTKKKQVCCSYLLKPSDRL